MSGPFLPSLPRDAVVLDLYKFDLELAKPLLRIQQHIMRGPSELTPAERELIAATVSDLNACRFCYGVHSRVAARFGAVDPGRLAPILAYVKKLTETPSRMTRADAEAVYAAGWSERALFQAVAVCALFSFFNRFVDGTGIDAAAVDFDKVAAGLHEIGYEGRLKL